MATYKPDPLYNPHRRNEGKNCYEPIMPDSPDRCLGVDASSSVFVARVAFRQWMEFHGVDLTVHPNEMEPDSRYWFDHYYWALVILSSPKLRMKHKLNLKKYEIDMEEFKAKEKAAAKAVLRDGRRMRPAVPKNISSASKESSKLRVVPVSTLHVPLSLAYKPPVPFIDETDRIKEWIPVPGSILPSDKILWKYDQPAETLKNLVNAGHLESNIPTPAEQIELAARKRPPKHRLKGLTCLKLWVSILRWRVSIVS